jgi:hypothetical protein
MHDTHLHIGIDPGGSGGIVGLMSSPLGIVLTTISPWKSIEESKNSLELCLQYKPTTIIACIENVHAFPTDGRSSAFKFGKNAGQWEGLLTGLGIPFYHVVPHKWMSSFGELPKDKKDRKNRLKALANKELVSLGSTIKATLKTADAMLIATYSLREE